MDPMFQRISSQLAEQGQLSVYDMMDSLEVDEARA
jgi:hypothetical protein